MTLARLLGTVLCTLARVSRPRTQVSPAVLSAWYWLVVVLVKVWLMPAPKPVVVTTMVVGSPAPLNVFCVVTLGKPVPPGSLPVSVDQSRYGRCTWPTLALAVSGQLVPARGGLA